MCFRIRSRPIKRPERQAFSPSPSIRGPCWKRWLRRPDPRCLCRFGLHLAGAPILQAPQRQNENLPDQDDTMDLSKIPIGPNPPADVNVVVEVPLGGEPIKY